MNNQKARPSAEERKKAHAEWSAQVARRREQSEDFRGWCPCAPRAGRLVIDTWPAICGDCKKNIDPRKEE